MIVKFNHLNGSERGKAIYGGFNLRIYFANTYVEIGRGSYAAIQNLVVFKREANTTNCLAKLGQFVEVNKSASILLGGNHQRTKFGFTSFTGQYELLTSELGKLTAPKSENTTTIGNAVVISTGVICAPGVHIGDDVLVGAGAVLPKGHYPSGLYAGNPAKLRREFEQEVIPFWKYRTKIIPKLIASIDEETKSVESLEFDQKLFLEFKGKISKSKIVEMNFIGIEKNGQKINTTQIDSEILQYFQQASGNGQIVVDTDIDLKLLNLFDLTKS